MIPKGTALITGAARRIGADLAIFLAGQGYDIALHYHHSAEAAGETALHIKALGRTCRLFQADLSHADAAVPLMQDVVAQCPDLNILINNASIYPPVSFDQTSSELFDACFQLHVRTPFFLTQHFAQHVTAGCIVNFVDTQIRRNPLTHFVYQLSKQALVHLTEMSAKALAPAIRVNGIAPGKILAPTTPGPEPADPIPLRRLGNLADIRQAVLFLLANSYITGQILYIDGGQTL